MLRSNSSTGLLHKQQQIKACIMIIHRVLKYLQAGFSKMISASNELMMMMMITAMMMMFIVMVVEITASVGLDSTRTAYELLQCHEDPGKSRNNRWIPIETS